MPPEMNKNPQNRVFAFLKPHLMTEVWTGPKFVTNIVVSGSFFRLCQSVWILLHSDGTTIYLAKHFTGIKFLTDLPRRSMTGVEPELHILL